MFLGYSPNHSHGVYHFLNLKTNKVVQSCNMIWFNKAYYGDYKKLKTTNIFLQEVDDSDDEPNTNFRF